MKRIVITYWKERDLIPFFNENSVFDYSPAKQAETIQIIIDAGFSAMVRPNMGSDKDTLLIYIDKGRFGQS
jgi:hypothetical protein